METVGYLASIIVGILLGLIGGGGSILMVPILVYIFKIEVLLATAYSLFIVGVTSLVGTVQYFREKLVNVKTAFVFGVPSIVSVFLTRKLIVPAIPDVVFTIGSVAVSKDVFIMVIFAIVMILASYSMIKKPTVKQQVGMAVSDLPHQQHFNFPAILIGGFLVGILTGLVGVGGGFLIIPALLKLSELSMKEAVGTTLLIITANSLIGFLGVHGTENLDWPFMLKITAFALLGLFIGLYLSKKIDGKKLRPAFGWFVLIMGIYILVREIWFN